MEVNAFSYLYQKTISFGVLPNATSKSVAHGISNLDKVIDYRGIAYMNNSGTRIHITFPFISEAGVTYNIKLLVNGANIVATTGNNYSTYTESYVTLLYTKS